ncbi:DUF3306 domain-containing protein [Halomonas alimentaria]|uniref:DUF3306 domain-containing protein n=1 Tax=Halomonas alimentaria TaxID=147248 RepID=UPI002490B302|nr:DUF3306 domain-containing protein [Halomonas alimentaria]
MSRFERWSRRKLGEEVLDEPDRKSLAHSSEHVGDAVADEAPQDEAVEPEGAVPGSLDHTLPDPDSLPRGADFTAYLKQGVSGQLRRRALRRLWTSGNYGVRDGLDDYDENYREVLKPLARDVAEQLRRWTRPSEEAPEATESELLAEAPQPAEDQRDESHDDGAQAAPRHETDARNRLDEEAISGDNKFS